VSDIRVAHPLSQAIYEGVLEKPPFCTMGFAFSVPQWFSLLFQSDLCVLHLMCLCLQRNHQLHRQLGHKLH